MSQPAIRIEGLSKRYHIGRERSSYRTARESIVDFVRRPFRGSAAPGDSTALWALSGVDLEVPQGATVGLIGRNGAGKSTLLKILSRITEPTSGSAEIRGRIGSLLESRMIVDVSAVGTSNLSQLFEKDDPCADLKSLSRQNLPRFGLHEVRLLPPVEEQEVWAVGVTYLRSKKARMEESDFSATAYDRVYDAARPELFFKAMPHKVVGHGDSVGIRKDANRR